MSNPLNLSQLNAALNKETRSIWNFVDFTDCCGKISGLHWKYIGFFTSFYCFMGTGGNGDREMGKQNLSWRRSALTVAALMFGVGARVLADGNTTVVFTPPASAPQGGAGTVGIQEVYNGTAAGGGINDQDGARGFITTPIVGSQIFNYSAPVVNILDSGSDGHFGNNSAFVAATSAVPAPGVGNVDNLALVIQGRVHIPTAGVYTFGVNSDDGFTLAFNNGTTPFSNPNNASTPSYNGNANGALTFLSGRGAADSLGQVTLAAGDHPFVMTYHEGGGGSEVELFAAKGAQAGFNSLFHLVGGSDGPVIANFTRFTGTTTGFQVATIHGNNANSLSDALTDLTAVFNNTAVTPRGTGTPVVTKANTATVNFIDPEAANDGGHGGGQTYPGDTPGLDDDHFSTGAIANLTIPAGRGGHYTFLTFSDDSSRTRIISTVTGKGIALVGTSGGTSGGVDSDGDGINDAYTNDGGCCSDILGTYNLTPGTYVIETVSNEQGGGAGHFLYGEFGDASSFNPGFQLVGQNLDDVVNVNDPGSLALVAAPEPGSIALLGLGGIAALARRRRA
jgi:hypothetical protein